MAGGKEGPRGILAISIPRKNITWSHSPSQSIEQTRETDGGQTVIPWILSVKHPHVLKFIACVIPGDPPALEGCLFTMCVLRAPSTCRQLTRILCLPFPNHTSDIDTARHHQLITRTVRRRRRQRRSGESDWRGWAITGNRTEQDHMVGIVWRAAVILQREELGESSLRISVNRDFSIRIRPNGIAAGVTRHFT